MYPAGFDYLAPTTVDEVLAVLAERGDEAKVLAGGQSLIPMMKLRFAFPETLVDINRVPGLDFLEEADGHLRVGALVRHNDVVASDVVERANHTMAAAAPWIADPIVRNLGTVGGSVAHADPLGDWASVMLACGADVVARSTAGERVIPMADFISGPFTTALEPTELLTELRVPKYVGRGGGTYLKLERKVGDYATVGVAIHLDLDEGGTVSTAGIALTSVASHNIEAVEAEQVLVGETPSEALFAEAADLAASAAEPRDDVRGTVEYKREIVRVFTRRGLNRARSLAQTS
jgi:aerobic carbon-monoxide dehydrogenase medium subunit